MKTFNVGALVRATNRLRMGIPSHGDLCRVIAVGKDQSTVRVIRVIDGSRAVVGGEYNVKNDDVETLDRATQIGILEEMKDVERKHIAKSNSVIANIDERIQYLNVYGTEEEAIIGAVFDVGKRLNWDRQATITEVAAMFKGKINFI